VDCRCVAAAGASTADASVTSMRRSKSAKEPCQRFESWLVLECELLCCLEFCRVSFEVCWSSFCALCKDEAGNSSLV
jgi:hypothetical protein